MLAVVASALVALAAQSAAWHPAHRPAPAAAREVRVVVLDGRVGAGLVARHLLDVRWNGVAP